MKDKLKISYKDKSIEISPLMFIRILSCAKELLTMYSDHITQEDMDNLAVALSLDDPELVLASVQDMPWDLSGVSKTSGAYQEDKTIL